VSIPTPQSIPTPVPDQYQPEIQRGLTSKQARNTDIAQGLAAFQNAMQRRDALKQQQLQQQGAMAVQRINQAGQNPDKAQAVAAQAKIISENAAALRSVGVPVPADPGTVVKPNIFQKIIGAIGGTPDRSAQNAPAAKNAMASMPGQTPEQQAAAQQAKNAATLASATGNVLAQPGNAETAAKSGLGLIPKPADESKAADAAAAKLQQIEAKAQADRNALKAKLAAQYGVTLADDGTVGNMPDDQLPPGLQIKKKAADSAFQVAEARASLMQAMEDVKKAELSGDLPALQIARQRVAVSQQNANTAEANYRMHALGTDAHGAPLPGIQTDTSGNPVGTTISGQQNATARADKSYDKNSAALDKIQQPLDALNMRVARLNETLAQNTPAANALVAPELLTIMAGGQGSGLRMNEAEISRIVGGRSKWQTLEATLNQWKTDPSKAQSITPEQSQQIQALTKSVNDKLQLKIKTINDARDRLLDSNDPSDHRTIVNGVRRAHEQIDNGTLKPGGLPGEPQPTAATHDFSMAAWKAKNPNGDLGAQVEKAVKAGFAIKP
jgi:hypothetical protein